MANGFVKLSRDLEDWEWFNDANTFYVYVRLLMKARWCDKVYNGVPIKRGQLITTYPKISEECGISVQQARTILDRLKSTGKITVKITPKFSIVTILDYDSEETDNIQSNSRTTGCQQAEQQPNNSPSLLYKESKNIRKKEPCAPREGGGSENFEKFRSANFEKFWSAYPKKTAKQQALKAFEKLNPDEKLLNTILSSLEQHKRSVQWTKENGQFIPYPATWLNGRRWEDETQGNTASGAASGWTGKPLTEEEERQMIDDFFNR